MKPKDKQTHSERPAENKSQFAYHRIVAKFGTQLLTRATRRLDLEAMASLVGQVARLHEAGVELIVVSSGAIAAGRHRLGGIKERRDLPFKQVLASVGQPYLMNAYEQLFQWHGIPIAQALLTKGDLSDRSGYINTRNTLLALMELGVIGIVNENDVVAIDEIREAKFGDNDNLSAMVANLVDADLLILLGEVGGLYTADPTLNPDAKLIPVVERIDEDIERIAGGSSSDVGTGGMATKIQAAKLATASGVAVSIAYGGETDVLVKLAAGEQVGTFFRPTVSKIESRRRWILSGLSRKGKIITNDGAVSAIKQGAGSLLPAGILRVEGDFQRGDTVDICTGADCRVAIGVANYSARDLNAIKSLHSEKIVAVLGYDHGDEAVHRNNMVVI